MPHLTPAAPGRPPWAAARVCGPEPSVQPCALLWSSSSSAGSCLPAACSCLGPGPPLARCLEGAHPSRPGSLGAFCCALPTRGSPGGAPLPVRGPCRPGSSCHPRCDWPRTHWTSSVGLRQGDPALPTPGPRRLSHGLWGGWVGTAPRGLGVGRGWDEVALAAAGLATRRGRRACGSPPLCLSGAGTPGQGEVRNLGRQGPLLKSGCEQVVRPARQRSSVDGLDSAQPVACLWSRGGRGPSVACRETSGPATEATG